MLETLVGVVFCIGSLLAFFWFGYRAVITGQTYRSVTAADGGTPTNFVDGNEVTIEGEVVVEESANEGVDGETAIETASVAILSWEILLGQKETGGWSRVESGLEVGAFAIDTGRETIPIDSTWLREHRGGKELWTLSADDLSEHSLRQSLESKVGSTTPFVYLEGYRDAFTFDEKTVLSPDVHAELGSYQRRYKFEANAVPDGESITVHGTVAIEQGRPVIRGTDEVPMTISDGNPESLGRRLRAQLLETSVYAVGSIAAAGGFLFLTVGSVPL